jgi:glycosyltransferase involved in cell wall biosynthesis
MPKKKFKIGVNGWFFSKPETGIGQYCLNFFSEIAKIDKNVELIIYVPKKVEEKFPANMKFKVVPVKKGPLSLTKTYWEQISLPKLMLKDQLDIAWFPYACNPWYQSWYKKGVKTVTTVHDCIPWLDKNYQKRLRSKIYQNVAKKNVKNSDLIFTVSEDSKKDIIATCKVKNDQIVVVPNAAADIFKKQTDKQFYKEYGLEAKKYFVYFGGFDSRKNVNLLTNQMQSLLSKKAFKELKLLIVGKELKNTENIFYTKKLDQKTLANIVQNSLAFISLSKKEGFNIPALEAAYANTNIILSDTPVHRELYDGHAYFIEINDSNKTKKQLEEVIKNLKKPNQKALSQKYTWAKSAKLAYNKIVWKD